MKFDGMTQDDLYEMVQEAQEELFSAIEKLERYVRVTGDGHTEAYHMLL
jgi:hypothetical protein